MTDSTPDPPEIDPAVLAGATFTRVRKGFEPAEVHKLLGRAADALRAWQERDDRLVERLAALEQRLEESNELDEQRLTTVLGEETARIVKAARDAAAEIRANAQAEADQVLGDARTSATEELAAARAEATELRESASREREDAVAEAARVRTEAIEEVARLRAEAVEEAARVRQDAESEATTTTEAARAEAERRREESEEAATRLREEAQATHDEMLERAGSVLDERTAEAEAVASGIRETAEAELSAARLEGERIRTEAREAAAEEIERARAEGREMVAEARRVRERMLRDLAERRRTARRQIEAARAGRDRIVEALRATSDTLDDAVADLNRVDDEAARAADAAAAAVDDDIDHVVAELETGLAGGSFGPDESDADAAAGDGVVEEIVVDEVVVEEVVIADEVVGEEETGPAEDDAASDEASPDGTALAEVTELEVAPVDDDAEDAGPVEPADGDDEPSPGATVHDLFERIRAERGSAADTGGGVAVDVTEAATATITLTDEGPRPAEEAVDEPAAAVDPVTALLDRRDLLLAPAEKALARNLKRLVSDEQNEVLDRLRRIKRGRPDLDTLLPAGPDADRFVDALEPEFGSAVSAGELFWAEADGDADARPDPVEGPFPRLRSLVEELLANRRAHVQRVLDDADAEGLELAELGDHVRAAYREWRSGPIPELAGDLATAGFAEGVRRAAGPDATWCWIPDNGGLPCSDAEDNALAGAVTAGDEFPTGDAFPPAHSGCRCILAPARR